MPRLLRTLLCICTLLLAPAAGAQAGERDFTLFSADLAEGWDGGEKTDFQFGDSQGYMLVLTHADASGDGVGAAVSIFVLPNVRHEDSATQARNLAKLQANASEPRQEGNFWVFSGEPRSRSLAAPALTRVSATETTVLIAIVQDSGQFGAEGIFAGLRGRTPEARALLGR